MREGVGIVGERSRADQRRAALNAGMGDVLKIIRRGAIIVQRGSHGSDRHPVSAMQAGKEETRQVRRGNVLIAHMSSPGSGSSRFHFPIDKRKSQRMFVRRTMFVHRQWLCGLENPCGWREVTFVKTRERGYWAVDVAAVPVAASGGELSLAGEAVTPARRRDRRE
jgi:hypothetical protein